MSDTKERKLSLGQGYWLCNDQYSWWISKEYFHKKGKNLDKPYMKNLTGYHISVENAFLALSEAHTRMFNTQSIKSLIKEVKSLKSLITELTENIK